MWIFLLAVFFRILVVVWGVGFDRDLTFFDARDYDRHALNFLSGKGLTNGIAWASRPPLYPLFLAGVYRLFGHSYLAVRLLQSLLGALTILLVYGALRLYFSRSVSLWTSFFTACHPLLVSYAGNILSETLSLFCLALFLVVFLRGKRGVDGWGGGTLFGVLLLCRASFIFFLPFVLFHIVRDKKNSAALFGFLLSAGLILAPWAIRNDRILHRFVPLTTNGGTTFWDANNPESLTPSKIGLASHWEMPGQVTISDRDIREKTVLLSEVEGDRYLYKKGFLFLGGLLRKDPLLFFYLLLRKGLAAFSLHSGKSVAELFGFGFLYLVCLPLGLWQSSSFERKPTLLYGLLLQYLIASLVFFGRAKYRLVIEPYLLAFVVSGILTWQKRKRPSH